MDSRGDRQEVHPDWSVGLAYCPFGFGLRIVIPVEAKCRDPHRRDITKSTLMRFRRTKLGKAAQPCTQIEEQIATRESISR